jgi:hypothetical protein
MKRSNLYTDTGEPKRVACYMEKKPKHADYITVVFTYVSKAGYPTGTVLYRAMNGNPYHPACGICLWGESTAYKFNPGGSRIKFSELPTDCQEVIRRDYEDLWRES